MSIRMTALTISLCCVACVAQAQGGLADLPGYYPLEQLELERGQGRLEVADLGARSPLRAVVARRVGRTGL